MSSRIDTCIDKAIATSSLGFAVVASFLHGNASKKIKIEPGDIDDTIIDPKILSDKIKIENTEECTSQCPIKEEMFIKKEFEQNIIKQEDIKQEMFSCGHCVANTGHFDSSLVVNTEQSLARNVQDLYNVESKEDGSSAQYHYRKLETKKCDHNGDEQHVKKDFSKDKKKQAVHITTENPVDKDTTDMKADVSEKTNLELDEIVNVAKSTNHHVLYPCSLVIAISNEVSHSKKPENSFKCNFCEFSTCNVIKYNCHLIGHHKKKKPNRCQNCEAEFDTTLNLKTHQAECKCVSKSSDEKFNTHHISTAYYTASSNKRKCRHKVGSIGTAAKLHHKNKVFCPLIHSRDRLSNIGKLTKHKTTNFEKYQLKKCVVCDLFVVPSMLKEHKKRYHARIKNLLRCRRRDCMFTCFEFASLEFHNIVHDTQPPYRCPECDFRSDSSVYFDKHMLTHTDDKPYYCYRCNTCFSLDRSKFQDHIIKFEHLEHCHYIDLPFSVSDFNYCYDKQLTINPISGDEISCLNLPLL